MKRPWLVIALLLSLGVNIGVLATVGVARARAQKPERVRSERWDGDRGASRLERFAERLGLEGEPRVLFIEQQQQFFDSLQIVRQELGETRRALRAEIGSPSPAADRIDELLEDTARLTALMDRAFVDNALATRSILDEQQQQVFFELLRRPHDRGDRSHRTPDRAPPGPGPPP